MGVKGEGGMSWVVLMVRGLYILVRQNYIRFKGGI